MPVATLEKPKEETEKAPGGIPEEATPEEVAESPKEEDEEVRKVGAFLGPEGVIMLTIAVGLDALGILWFILSFFYEVGQIPSFISDVFGIAFFGTWIFSRWQFQTEGYGQAMERARWGKGERKKLAQAIKTKGKGVKTAFKAGRRTGLKFLVTIVGEFFPNLGDILPMWTWFVWSELKNG